jgi:predicted MFS family arabinose efflux permease
MPPMSGAAHVAEQRPALSGPAVFFLVFLPFALGHFLSSLLRTVNAVLAPTLLTTMALTPAQLGLLTSAFFFAFALAQLPVGVALDRYGPRRVQLVLMSLATLGTLLFGRGQNFTELMCARAIMGVGLGGCFMSAVKAISTWIAPAKLPSVQGYLIAAGGLGAAAATLPIRLALQYTDWRGLFASLAALVAIVGLLIFLLAPEGRRGAPRKPMTLGVLLDVYRDPGFRDTISLMLVPHAVFFGVQGLWVGKWLSDVAGLSDAEVAYLLYLSMAAVIFGAIGVGMLTEWAGRRGVAPLQVAGLGVALFVAVQGAMLLGGAGAARQLPVLFSLFGTITGLEYAIVAQRMPAALTGRAATCLNLLIFVGAFVVQAGFGLILGCWSPNLLHQYPPQAYQAAFAVLIALQLPGLIGYFLRRRRAAPSGRMTPANGHPAPLPTPKEEYETGPLWPPRQGEARPDRR